MSSPSTCKAHEHHVEEESIEEESWDLPPDFDLFATHQVRRVYFPNDKPEEDQEESSRRRCPYFEIECIEPSSPLDILNESQSLKQYDATGHCVWTGAFLLISCIDRVLNVIERGIENRASAYHSSSGSSSNENAIRSLHKMPKYEKVRMVELGCGTGVGGLALMLATKTQNDSDSGIRCCFTDYDPAVLGVCERNCQLNGLIEGESYTIQELTWGSGDNCYSDHLRNGSFDVVLATDVLYDVDLIHPLFSTVSRLLSTENKNENRGESCQGGCDDHVDNFKNSGIFILSHIPRACYNDNNPPEAVENLEKYIVDQAREKYGLYLKDVIRHLPLHSKLSPSSREMYSMDDKREECTPGILLPQNNGIYSFEGSAVFVFSMSNDDCKKMTVHT